MAPHATENVWILPGLRTPFAKAGTGLARFDALELSLPVVEAMMGADHSIMPDLLIWGSVIPSLSYSNLAREVVLEADLDPTIPALSTVMACATSMAR